MAATFRALNTESYQSGASHRVALPGAVWGDFVVILAGTKGTGCAMSVDGFNTAHLNGPDDAPTTAVFWGQWTGDTTIRFAYDTAKSWVAYAFDPYSIDWSDPVRVTEHRRPATQLNVALPDIDGGWYWPAYDDWYYATQGVAIGAAFYNGGVSVQAGTAPSQLPWGGVFRYGPDNTWLTMHAGGWAAYPSRPVQFPVFSVSANRRSASVAVVIHPKTPPYVTDFWWWASGLGLQFDIGTLENADSWSWDFGDGDSSSARAPHHQFRNIAPGAVGAAAAQVGTTSLVNANAWGAVEYPGAYLVTATAGNGYGARNRQEWVGDFPRPQYLEYVWDWGDGTSDTTTSAAASHHYFPGTYTITVTARNNRGQVSTTTGVVVKPEPPIAAFRWSRQPGLRVELQDESQRADTRTWYLVDAAGAETAIGTDAVLDWLFATPGTYRVRLRVANVSGSSQTDRIIALDADWTAVELPNGLTTVVQLGASEVTCDVQDMSWSWGARSDEGLLSSPDATRLAIRLYDPDGDLDPDNAAGRWAADAYVGNDCIVRVGTPLDMGLAWRGWVEAISHDGTTARIDVTDAIGRLSTLRWEMGGPVARPAETVYQRLTGLLAHVGWPTALQDIAADSTPLQAITLQGSSAWSQVANAALGAGVLDVTAAGLVRYRPRAAAMTPPASEAAIGCLPGDVPVASVTREQGLGAMANDVAAGNSDLGSHRWYDQASKDKHGIASASFTYPWASATDRDSFAQAVLAANSVPPVTLRCLVRPDQGTILRLLGLRFRDTVDVVVSPYDTQAWVLGGRWYLDPRRAELELLTSAVPAASQLRAWGDGGAVGWVPDEGTATLAQHGIVVHRAEAIPNWGPGADTIPFTSTPQQVGDIRYDVGSRDVIVPVAGWYSLTATVHVSIDASGYRDMQFLIDGAPSWGLSTETPNSTSYGRALQLVDTLWLEKDARVALRLQSLGTPILWACPATMAVVKVA